MVVFDARHVHEFGVVLGDFFNRGANEMAYCWLIHFYYRFYKQLNGDK